MRIGVLYRQGVPNVHYRAFGPVAAAQALGFDVVAVEQDRQGRFDLKALLSCDLVHIYRCADPAVVAAVEQLHEQRIAVVWDTDDDIRRMPEATAGPARIPALRRHQEFNAQRKMMRRADVVTTSSETLARAFREVAGDKVVQVENYLAPHQLTTAKRRHDGVVVGWVAGAEHAADERALRISDVFRTVLGGDPHVHVVTIGIALQLDPSRYTHRKSVQFPELPDEIAQFDIGIAPLADIPMTYARSNVKVKEYAGARVPWLASARGPYEGLGSAQGGVLVADDGWADAIATMAGSRLKRHMLRRRAAAWGKSQALERHAGQWGQAFGQALHARAAAGLPQRAIS